MSRHQTSGSWSGWSHVFGLCVLAGVVVGCQQGPQAEARLVTSQVEGAASAACAGRAAGDYCGGCMRCSATLDCNVPAGTCFPVGGAAGWSEVVTGIFSYTKDVWVASANDAWAVGYGVYHWDGVAWSEVTFPRLITGSLQAVWGTSASDVWIVGTQVFHWNGTTWTEFPNVLGDVAVAIHGTSSTNAIMVGGYNKVAVWDGTTWELRYPGLSDYLAGIWMSSPTRAFAFTYFGDIYHMEGTGWTYVAAPVGTYFNDIWGTGPDDVWAVGDNGAAYHWLGQSWASVPPGVLDTLNGVWGASADDVWAVGNSGRVVHWNGTAWTLEPSITTNSLEAIRGSSATEAWAVGYYTRGLHMGPMPCTSDAQCSDPATLPLCASGATCLPVDGQCLAIPMVDDARCGTLDCSALDTDCRSFPDVTANRCVAPGRCKAPNTVATCGSFVDAAAGTACRPGGTGATVPPCAQCDTSGSCSVTPQDDATCGTISCAGTGSACRDYAPITTNRCASLGQCKVASVSTCTVSTPTPGAYCGGCRTCDSNLECTQDMGTCFSAVTPTWSTDTSPATDLLLATWGASFGDVWAVGAGGTILHHNGLRWTAVDSGTTVTLRAVWGSGSSDVWAAGDAGTLLHWTGNGTWSLVPSGTTDPINGLWGASASDVWAVGGTASSSTVLRWNGTAWNSVASNTADFMSGIWGFSASDVWAVGRSGTSIHWDGTRWNALPTGATQNLGGVWGNSPGDVWAVGLSGTIRHWNGSAWSPAASNTSTYFYAVWGNAEDDIWAVGSSSTGSAVHWDGTRWNSVSTGDANVRLGVWGSSGADVWAVGGAGTIIHLRAPACGGNPECAASPNLPMCLDGATCLGRDGLCLAGTPMADDARCGTIDCNALDTTCEDYNSLTSARCTVGTPSSHARCKAPNTLATCTDVVAATNGTPCADPNPCIADAACQDRVCTGGTAIPLCNVPDAGPASSSSSSHGPSSSVSLAGASSSSSRGVSSSAVVVVSSSAATPSSGGASASVESGASGDSSAGTSTAASVASGSASSAAGSAAPPDNGGGGGGGKSGPCACATLPAATPFMGWLGLLGVVAWRRRRA